jgi:hypothetical protein
MLDGLISECETKGRLLTDYALIAFECFHSIQRYKEKEGSFRAYKLDLTKAYERVGWNYVENFLSKFGFSSTFVGWIMRCISSIHFRIKTNGALTKGFKPSRGIRQGGSLSPYLFLFVGRPYIFLQKTFYLEELRDLKICRRAPGLSHLLLADNSLFF